jgi:very-short-patch-repair endonuclease
MTLIFNRNADKKKRRRLRNNMTDAEKKLWGLIRYKKIGGHKFRRQHSIAGYVVDFYCLELRLALEVDGGVHQQETVKGADKERERVIKSISIEFLRFSNEQVLTDPIQTISRLRDKINDLKSFN